MAYRWLSNWLATGTCWVEMAFRSAWIWAWVMLGVKTQTFGPNVAELASGQMLAAAGGEGCAGCALARRPVPASVAAASTTTTASGLINRRMSEPLCAALTRHFGHNLFQGAT